MKATLHDLSFTMDGAQVISFRTTEDCRALYEQLKAVYAKVKGEQT